MSAEHRESERRNKIIPVTQNAAEAALEKITREDLFPRDVMMEEAKRLAPGSDLRESLLMQSLFHGVIIGYRCFPGFKGEPEGPEGRDRVAAWDKGLDTYAMAARITGDEVGLEVPRLHVPVVDTYLNDINSSDEGHNQNSKFYTKDFAEGIMMGHLEEQVEKSAHFYLNSNIVKRREKVIMERTEKISEVEPQFSRAVKENPPCENSEQLKYFLAGARVMHDLFDLHYQIEQMKKMTELE